MADKQVAKREKLGDGLVEHLNLVRKKLGTISNTMIIRISTIVPFRSLLVK